jgi:hypothetical protein
MGEQRQTCIFIGGGPFDGKIHSLLGRADSYDVIERNGRHSERIKTRTRRYEKVHESSDGSTAVYEFEPGGEKFYFVVEVDVIPSADEKLAERVLNDVLRPIDRHPDSFPGGILAARVDHP